MGSEEEQELEDRWWLGWRGLRIDRVERAGEGTAIFLGDRSQLVLDRPESSRLVGDRVLSAVAFKSGALRVVLSSGRHLSAEPSQAWKAIGESGRAWVATADGLDVTRPIA